MFMLKSTHSKYIQTLFDNVVGYLLSIDDSYVPDTTYVHAKKKSVKKKTNKSKGKKK